MAEQEGEAKSETNSPDPLAQWARQFLDKRSVIEAMLRPLLDTGSTGGFSWTQQEIDFVGATALRFMGIVTFVSREDAEERLTAAGVTDTEIDTIREFVERYSHCQKFFLRTYRTDQGFENELTSATARPMLYVKSEQFVIDLALYSHDRLIVACKQELDVLMILIESLLSVVRSALKSSSDIRKDLPAKALEPNLVQRVVEAAESLYEFIPKPSASTEESGATSE